MAVCLLSLTGSQYTQTGNIEEEMWIKLAFKTLQNKVLTLKHLRLVHDLDFFSEIDRWISLKCDMMSDNGHLPAPSGIS